MTEITSKPVHGADIGETQDGKSVRATDALLEWFDELEQRLNDEVIGNQVVVSSYTVATLPPVPSTGIIFVSDETGGATLAFADGTNWRRTTDLAIVS